MLTGCGEAASRPPSPTQPSSLSAKAPTVTRGDLHAQRTRASSYPREYHTNGHRPRQQARPTSHTDAHHTPAGASARQPDQHNQSQARAPRSLLKDLRPPAHPQASTSAREHMQRDQAELGHLRASCCASRGFADHRVDHAPSAANRRKIGLITALAATHHETLDPGGAGPLGSSPIPLPKSSRVAPNPATSTTAVGRLKSPANPGKRGRYWRLRRPVLQAGGHRFDPGWLHSPFAGLLRWAHVALPNGTADLTGHLRHGLRPLTASSALTRGAWSSYSMTCRYTRIVSAADCPSWHAT